MQTIVVFFTIQRRSLGFPIFLSVAFRNAGNLDPTLDYFYYWGSADYGIYITKKDTSVWELWSLKSEVYDVVEILQMNANLMYFKIELPNGFSAEKGENWISPQVAGRVAGANHVYDTYNGNLITGAYGKPGINYNEITWLNCWNGYEMRAIHKNCFTYLKQISDPKSGSFFGLCVPPMAGGNDGNDQAWIRTTKEGILPYLSGGDSAVGTSSWPFREGHINNFNCQKFYVRDIEFKEKTGEIATFKLGNNSFMNFCVLSNGELRMILNINPTCVYPNETNTVSLGDSSSKWKDVYAANGVIQTSDRNEKKDISYIGEESEYKNTIMSDETLIDFIRNLKPCVFLRIDGDSGRPHHGFISQDFKKCMGDVGITDHAAYIKSPKVEYIEKEVEQEREVYDEITKKTKIVKEKVKTQEERIIEGEYNEGLRYEEIISDHVRFSQILDKRITTLENIILSQTKEIEYLKQKLDELTTK